jgi:DNA-binding NarL/FixJ family response regulator
MTVVEGKLRVYIVEDSPIFLKAIENLLAENECIAIVGCASEAAVAMREIPRLAPEVVILDFHLIGGSGIDVLKSIKAQRIKAQHINAQHINAQHINAQHINAQHINAQRQASPIAIMFSSHAEPAFRRVSMKLGADFFFEKSREFDLLAQLLRSMTSSLDAARIVRQNDAAVFPNISPDAVWNWC